MKKIKLFIKTHLLVCLTLTIPLVYGQSNKPLTILVPFATGGTVDIVARQLSIEIGQVLDKPVIIDNRGGGGGTIAIATLARSKPDGDVILIDHMGITFDEALYDKLPYDTKKDIVPVAYIGVTPNVLVVSNKLPVKNIKEFIAYAQEHPQEINYGSGGVGSAGHIAMASFQASTGTLMTHIPYKGSGPAITDLISGQIQAMLMTMASIKPYIDSGKVRALATSGKMRSAALPNVPTIAEAGVKDFNFTPWYAVFAPAQTPSPILDKLHNAINTSLQNPTNKTKLALQGLEASPMKRSEFQEIFNADLVLWGDNIRKLNIKN